MADANEIELELNAIRALVEALTPLSDAARQRAIEYASAALNMAPDPARLTGSRERVTTAPQAAQERASVRSTDIRSLAQEKRPRSAIEMAALIAYYLSEVAPAAERKDAVTTDDLRRYFKQANFPLPGAIQYTLGNAAAAGYFESAGRGQYGLSPVGYNLVAHVLPASDEPSPAARRAPRRKTAANMTKAMNATAKKARGKKSAP